MIIFADSRDPNRVPESPLKKPDLDTYFLLISNCCAAARPRGLQKIVYFNWGSTCRKVWEPLL